MANIQHKKTLYILFFILFLSGCATNKASVTYYSDPPGATIYQGSTVYGTAPLKLNYVISSEDIQKGYIQTNSTTAQWVSGASTSDGGLILYLNEGRDFQYSFIRPNVPGRETDINYSIQLQQNQILQKQLDIQQRKEATEMIRRFGDGLQKIYAPTPSYTPSYAPIYTPPKNINCTSSNYGGYSTYTDCTQY